ncbi:MAG TPA: aminotransferase class V-fold PLP-dependent enzyme [Jiangellaceae bacterium]
MAGYHMPPDDFRRYGHEMVDWIADYLERVEELPVQSAVQPGDVRAGLPEHPPERPEPFDQIMKDVDEIILPGVTHWQSPNWFAYFPANSSEPSILGELLSAGLGVQGMLWSTSPAATELETHVLDWLVELLGLPDRFKSDGGGGVIQDSASSATLCALLAARERAASDDAELTVYTSTQAHSSVEKAVRIAGLGGAAPRLVPVDEQHAMRMDDLAALVESDVADGRLPILTVATVGSTSSAAVDPVREIGELCRKYGMWLHVDAAMAGTAALLPEHRNLHDGVELADSYCTNPHKWMFTNFDCDAFYVADRRPLIAALSVLPEYLRNEASESGAVIDYRDWQVPLGRRFRALKLWFVIRHYGAEGLRHHVGEHIALARELAGWVADDDRFELVNGYSDLNLVCLRHRDGDDPTRRVLDAVNATGRAYLTHTKLDDRLVIRVSVGQTRTERRHVEALWEELQKAASSNVDNDLG